MPSCTRPAAARSRHRTTVWRNALAWVIDFDSVADNGGDWMSAFGSNRRQARCPRCGLPKMLHVGENAVACHGGIETQGRRNPQVPRVAAAPSRVARISSRPRKASRPRSPTIHQRLADFVSYHLRPDEISDLATALAAHHNHDLSPSDGDVHAWFSEYVILNLHALDAKKYLDALQQRLTANEPFLRDR